MRRGVTVAALLAAGVAVLPARVVHGAVARVGDPATCRGAQFRTIQSALDTVPAGWTVVVCAGTYAEQITIDKPLRLRGEPGAVVRPAAMIGNTTSLRTGRAVAAIAVVHAPATVEQLEFDGSANGITGCDGAPFLMGVHFRGVSGKLRNCRIHGVRLEPAERSCDTGAAVGVEAGGLTKVKVTGNTIFDYQRAGILVTETGVLADIRSNVIMGAGPTPDLAQSGIEVGFGAAARVRANVVQDNLVPSGADCTFDGGNLLFDAHGGTIAGNIFSGNTAGVIVTGDGNRIVGNAVDGFLAGTAAGLTGITVYGHGNLVRKNRVWNMSQAGIRLVGDLNRVLANSIIGTRADNMCESTRTLPGCEAALAVCGVGVWTGGGAGNVVGRNTFVGNDVDLRDDGVGAAPVERRSAP